MTVGIGPTETVAPVSRIRVSSMETASATTTPASVGSSGFASVSIRESWSRSRISASIRTPPSTMNAMYSSASGPSCPRQRRSRSWLKLTIVRNGSCRSWLATYANRCSSSFDRRSSSSARYRSVSSIT